MTDNWFKSQFTAVELMGKSVQFRVPLEPGGVLAGLGKMDAIQDARGYIRVAINHVQMDGARAMGQRLFVPAAEGGKLVKNPTGSECEFSLIIE